jgi:hypothetical protein
MNCYEGFILSPFQKENGEMTQVPFFPHVRESDIIYDDPIDITTELDQMSERWVLNIGTDTVDRTSYTFHSEYKNKTFDLNDEQIGSKNLNATVRYDLFRDGTMEVTGTVRLDGSDNTFGEDRYLGVKTLYLPYAITDNTTVQTGCALGPVEGLTVGAFLEKVPVTNKNLNPDGSALKYYGRINFRQICPLKGGDEVPLDYLYRAVDIKYAANSYYDYISKYLPLTFKISDIYWR